MHRLWLLASASVILSSACNEKTALKRTDPLSFNVKIVCAGKVASDCPAVPPKAADCPVFSGTVDLGSPTSPVDRTQGYYEVQAVAVGNDGTPDLQYSGHAGVYVMFEGSVSPTRAMQSDQPRPDGQPLPLQLADGTWWLQFTGGKACFGVTLPPAFDTTSIWVEDVPRIAFDPAVPADAKHAGKRAVSGAFALGSSQPIFRPPPSIADLQESDDTTFTVSQLANKRVAIESGSNGAPLVVTSVGLDSFTLTDLGTPGEDHAWGSTTVSSVPPLSGIRVGSTVRNVSGTVASSDGLSEITLATWDVARLEADPEHAPLPSPHPILSADLPQTLTRMKPWESALVVARGWKICAMTDSDRSSYLQSFQWRVLGPGATDCSDWRQTLTIVSHSSVPGFDPSLPGVAGLKFCALTGILSHFVPAPGTHQWIITPRNAADLGMPVDPAAGCP